MNVKWLKLYLRLAIGIGFLSAVADRLGFYPKKIAVWGDWNNFLSYTEIINPWLPQSIIPLLGILATALEIAFGICLIIGFKTKLIANLSGILMLLFALSITFSTGFKGAFDYSVFAASAGAFSLAMIKEKFLELDQIIKL